MLRYIKIVLSLIVVSLFINSCDDYCEMTDYEAYLPLKIGNKWTYYPETKWEVIGKKNINGNSFYDIIIEYRNYDGIVSSYHSYYRFNDSKLFIYSNSDSLETLLADFSLKEGEMFYQENTGFNVTVWSDNPNEFELHYDHPEIADEEYEITFKHDVGIISECSISWGGCTELTDYKLE